MPLAVCIRSVQVRLGVYAAVGGQRQLAAWWWLWEEMLGGTRQMPVWRVEWMCSPASCTPNPTQAGVYKNVLHAAHSIVKAAGVRGLFTVRTA